MSTRLYYLLAFLPPLPPLGDPPPIDMAELLRIVDQERISDARLLAESFNFQAQLMQAATIKLLGYSSGDTAGTYSFGANSPPVVIDLFLRDPQEIGEDIWLTQLWIEYLDFFDSVGKTLGSSLLSRWASWEKSLRSQLLAARTGAGLDARHKDLALGPHDHRELIAEWRAASDPMIGEKILDQARMDFIERESRRYSFGIDELAAYFLKLSLLNRHAQMDRQEGIKILEEVTAL